LAGRRRRVPGRDAWADSREAAGSLSREAVAVRHGAVATSRVPGEAGAGARGPLVLFELALFELVLFELVLLELVLLELALVELALVKLVLLELLLLERVLAESVPGRRRLVLLRVPRLCAGVPRPGLRTAGKLRATGKRAGSRGHAAARSPEAGVPVAWSREAGVPVARSREARWAVGAGHSAARPAGKAGSPWWERRTPVIPRAGAVVRPGAGVGLRLPAPFP
ncbi:MAG TPA: hypothetical protein VGG83_24195, partial [Trebonia sp.]